VHLGFLKFAIIYNYDIMIEMSCAAPSNNGRYDLIAAGTPAEKRILKGSEPSLKGTARGMILQLVGGVRPELITKKEEPKAADKPAEKPKEEKPAAAAENKEPKTVEKKAA
jgi:hypothetical protein